MNDDLYAPPNKFASDQRLSALSDQIGESVVILAGPGSPGLVTQLSSQEIQMMANLLEELCAALPEEEHENLRARTRAIINVFWDTQNN